MNTNMQFTQSYDDKKQLQTNGSLTRSEKQNKKVIKKA